MPADTHLTILKKFGSNPQVSKRQLAQELSLSVGKINYCVQALITKGLVKAGNFKRSANKVIYLYLSTPAGIEEKVRLTASFLKRKVAEYEINTQEIKKLNHYAYLGTRLSTIEWVNMFKIRKNSSLCTSSNREVSPGSMVFTLTVWSNH
jgi:EPS-associated MarR family transcriptional regulator